MSKKKIEMLVNPEDKIGYINPEIYGLFTEHLGRCVYEGIYVGEDSPIPNTNGIRNDLVEAFRNIKVPVVRWPGGCFADEYHWKDGVGPKNERKEIVNTNWGGVTEDNSFGTHEFMEFCRQVGCEPFITGNVGSGTVQEMAEWIEYMTSDAKSPMTRWREANGQEKPWKLKYFGVGNESWGCGGNMRAEKYVDEYKQYQGYCKNYSGNNIFKIACGPTTADYNWTETLMKNITEAWHMQGIDLHYYTMPIWPDMESATEFDEDMYYKTIAGAFYLDEIIGHHKEIMNRYDPKKNVGLVVGEWGCWHQVEPGTNPGFLYQQNTMRDAIVAGVHLNIFNRHSDRVIMANLAQAVNVLQSIILTEGGKLVKTPTYHVFDLYKDHQGQDAVYCFVKNEMANEAHKIPAISASASVKDGRVVLTLVNTSASEAETVECRLVGITGKTAKARILTDDIHAFNDFENADKVKIKPAKVKLEGELLTAKLPACSVMTVVIE